LGAVSITGIFEGDADSIDVNEGIVAFSSAMHDGPNIIITMRHKNKQTLLFIVFLQYD
jgi:hypothetical protein